MGGCCCFPVAQLCLTFCDPMHCSAPDLLVSQHLLEFAKFLFIVSVMLSSHLILWHPLLLLSSVFPIFRLFSQELSVHIRWPKWGGCSFSISPSSEYSRPISLKTDWFDLLAVQGTFRGLLQHHSAKASVLWCSAFFMVQLSQLYVTTGKIIALTMQSFVSRVMSLLCNTLSRFVIDFLPRSSCLLNSWLQSPSAVILEPKKRKSVTTSTFSPICRAVMGVDDIVSGRGIPSRARSRALV